MDFGSYLSERVVGHLTAGGAVSNRRVRLGTDYLKTLYKLAC